MSGSAASAAGSGGGGDSGDGGDNESHLPPEQRHERRFPGGRNPKPHATPYITPRFYRCPELLCGSTAYSPASDIWALAVTLSEVCLMAAALADPRCFETTCGARGSGANDAADAAAARSKAEHAAATRGDDAAQQAAAGAAAEAALRAAADRRARAKPRATLFHGTSCEGAQLLHIINLLGTPSEADVSGMRLQPAGEVALRCVLQQVLRRAQPGLTVPLPAPAAALAEAAQPGGGRPGDKAAAAAGARRGPLPSVQPLQQWIAALADAGITPGHEVAVGAAAAAGEGTTGHSSSSRARVVPYSLLPAAPPVPDEFEAEALQAMQRLRGQRAEAQLALAAECARRQRGGVVGAAGGGRGGGGLPRASSAWQQQPASRLRFSMDQDGGDTGATASDDTECESHHEPAAAAAAPAVDDGGDSDGEREARRADAERNAATAPLLGGPSLLRDGLYEHRVFSALSRTLYDVRSREEAAEGSSLCHAAAGDGEDEEDEAVSVEGEGEGAATHQPIPAGQRVLAGISGWRGLFPKREQQQQQPFAAVAASPGLDHDSRSLTMTTRRAPPSGGSCSLPQLRPPPLLRRPRQPASSSTSPP